MGFDVSAGLGISPAAGLMRKPMEKAAGSMLGKSPTAGKGASNMLDNALAVSPAAAVGKAVGDKLVSGARSNSGVGGAVGKALNAPGKMAKAGIGAALPNRVQPNRNISGAQFPPGGAQGGAGRPDIASRTKQVAQTAKLGKAVAGGVAAGALPSMKPGSPMPGRGGAGASGIKPGAKMPQVSPKAL